MSSFLVALGQTLIMILTLIQWVVIINAILSWLIVFNVLNPRNQVVGVIWDATTKLTAPLLNPIRRFLPNLGGVDISPIVLLILIFFLQNLIVGLMRGA